MLIINIQAKHAQQKEAQTWLKFCPQWSAVFGHVCCPFTGFKLPLPQVDTAAELVTSGGLFPLLDHYLSMV